MEFLWNENFLTTLEDEHIIHVNELFSELRSKLSIIQDLQNSIALQKESLQKDKQSITDKENALKKDFEERLCSLEEKEKQMIKKIEGEKEKLQQLHEVQEGKIKLNIGGHIFTTSKATLFRDSESMFTLMFSGRHQNVKSDDDSYFIDRDGTHFRYVLNFLRGSIMSSSDLPDNVSILKELRSEADFYQLKGLLKLIDEALDSPTETTSFTQEEITEMMSTLVRDDAGGGNSSRDCNQIVRTSYLPEQNISEERASIGRAHFIKQSITKGKLNFKNKDLSRISFAQTTFFHDVSFLNARLTGASFYGCEFGAGVKINFNHADLFNCDFRQCKGKEVVSNLPFSYGGGLVSGSSSDTFLRMIKEGKITFKNAKIAGACFDPKVHAYLYGED